MINKIIQRLGRFFLKRHQGPELSKRRVPNFNEIKRLLMLAEIKTENDWNDFLLARDVFKKQWGVLELRGKVYLPFRKLPVWLKNSTEDIEIATKKEVNVFGKPFQLEDSKNYDLLIDLSSRSNITVLFWVKSTEAKLKVARQLPGNLMCFDILINVKDKLKMSYFLEQLEHYLKMFNQ